MTDTRPWVAAIYRLLKAELRPDPKNPQKQKHWNQGDLAMVANVRPNTLSSLMNGSEPSIDTLRKLGLALGVPLWAFFVSERQAALLNDQQRVEQQIGQETQLRERVRAMMAEEFDVVLNRAVDRVMHPAAPAPASPKPTLAPPQRHKRKHSA